MSPRELRLEFEAETLRRKDAAVRDLAIAWHVAMLSRSERIPSLTDLIGRVEAGGALKQTPKQQRAVLHQLSAQYGIPLKVVH